MHETCKDLISQNNHSTVMAYYEPSPRPLSGYQSEASMEAKLIDDLKAQGYEYAAIKNQTELLANLKSQLERLNRISLSHSEWERFCNLYLTNPKFTRIHKCKIIQTELESLNLELDSGEFCNIKLFDRADLFNNHLQVISQFEVQNLEGGGQPLHNRYDVSILVNGLPLVHIELKRRGVDLKEAFNQIRRYARESFSAGAGLFEFAQIFIISNGTITKYYSNSTRQSLSENAKSDNFAFAMHFSCAKNNAILELEDFTKSFLAKRTLLNILAKYCVFNTQNELLVMRPYQIAATERINDKILIAHNHKLYGSTDAGGYIWHSTGSGKTLTSFKSAILASKFDFIKKVLFVVDRKDLDYQSMKEYDNFQKGAANATKNTAALQEILQSTNPEHKIIITTIQKLSIFIQKHQNASIFNEEVVFIFDECHRSQFGLMHEQIKKKFKKHYLFGFTGTPIFEENANKNNKTTTKEYNALGENIGEVAAIKTTDLIFGEQLHAYTILNAIKDKNVLPFRMEYISTMREAEGSDLDIEAIKKETALNNPQRIANITAYILEHFDLKTKRGSSYTLEGKRAKGFNSIFATQSIESAKAYYIEFQKQIKALKDPAKAISIGIIYSYAPNEDLEEAENLGLSSIADSKAFLESAMNDYNAFFKTNFTLNDFDSYYKDISKRLKEQELDMLIVVDMFLTGFDSKSINTLWVDKNLRHHGLLQAYSRTNRILNSVKAFGNIVCFRDLEAATNQSLSLFGDKRAKSIVLLRSFEDYLHGFIDENGKEFPGYLELVQRLESTFPAESFPLTTQQEKIEFIALFGSILRAENILSAFDSFPSHNTLSPSLKQDYQSHYIDLQHEIRGQKEQVDISDDIVFEMELIKQADINVDFILFLLEAYHKDQEDKRQKSKDNIMRAIASSPSLRSKKELISEFLRRLDNNNSTDFGTLFKDFIQEKKSQELEDLIQEFSLQEGTKAFMEKAFLLKSFQTLGTEIDAILPHTPLFIRDQAQKLANKERRQRALESLQAYFERYVDLLIPHTKEH